MSNQPACRNRNHAYACRCGRCPQSRPGDWGIIGPAILIFFAVALIGFWPAMVWHGYTDTGGWRWDIHSTVAELVYFGVVGFIAWMIAAGNRPARVRPPERPASIGEALEIAAALPPPCYHRNAVPVDLSTRERVAWWCQECETRLPAEFRLPARLCCGSAPGTPHLYNCPQGGPR